MANDEDEYILHRCHPKFANVWIGGKPYQRRRKPFPIAPFSHSFRRHTVFLREAAAAWRGMTDGEKAEWKPTVRRHRHRLAWDMFREDFMRERALAEGLLSPPRFIGGNKNPD